MSIYFMLRPTDGAVKIGFSNRPYTRLRAVAKAERCDIKLLSLIIGGRREERILHEKYSELRLDGEWFSFEGPLKTLIDSLPKAIQVRKGARYPRHKAMCAQTAPWPL